MAISFIFILTKFKRYKNKRPVDILILRGMPQNVDKLHGFLTFSLVSFLKIPVSNVNCTKMLFHTRYNS